MIEYTPTPENFRPAYEKVLNGFAHVKFRDASGKGVVMMHEDEFVAVFGQEASEREKEILLASMQKDSSISFANAEELRAYFEKDLGLSWQEIEKIANELED